MGERTVQQMERELDTFWNSLVTGSDLPPSETPEAEVVLRLTTLQPATPHADFFDALWTRLLVEEPAESSAADSWQAAPAVAAPVVPLPIRPALQSPGGYRRWGKVAAAIAALLAIAAVSAILFANRQHGNGDFPAAQRWSMTGGDPGKTNGNPESSPITDPAVHWRTGTDGRIDGVPVVADSVVFVGNREHHVYALDAGTGLQLWEANLRKPVTRGAAVGGGIVVVGTTTTLYGLDVETGATVWQREDLIAQSSPTIVGDVVFIVDTDNHIRALALDSGEDQWSSDAFAPTPAFAIDLRRDRLIAVTPDGLVRALSTSDGVQLWETEPGLGTLGVPLVDGASVYVPIEGGVAQIDSATGELESKNVVPFEGVPALSLAGDQLVASTDVMVVSYDSDNLEVQWINQLLTGLTGGSTVGAASIYLPGSDRTLTALDRATGQVQWILPLDEVAQVAPAATSDRLYLSTRAGSVYAIGGGEASILNAPPTDTETEAGSPVHALWKSSGGPDSFLNPTGIAVAPSGDVWVCDTANDRLQVFDADGAFLREFGSHGSEPGHFDFGEETAEMDGYAPLGHHCSLAFDASGALYVADAANQRVQRFPVSELDWMIHSCCTIETAGTVLPYPASAARPDLIIGSEGTGDGQFLFASDIAIAPNGDIYVGDRHRIDVQRFDADGNYIETIGKPVTDDPIEPGTFIGIDGITIDQEGRLYIVDDEPQQIDRLEPDGTFSVFSLPHRDYRINGIAVDGEGHMFVAQIDATEGSFWIYDVSGKPLDRVGVFGRGLGNFDGPAGIALDGNGNVYVTDWAMNRFQKFEIDYEQLDATANDSSG